MSSLANSHNSVIDAEDSEDELDWEEVHIRAPQDQQAELEPEPEKRHLEITLSTRTKVDPTTHKKKGIVHADRLLRIECHKLHTICLLANAWVRNHWINDPLLHARLMSLTPLSLQNAFAVIHKSRVPDQKKRGRLFEAAMVQLTNWWSNNFFDVTSTGHIRNKTFNEVQELLGDGYESEDEEADEVIRSSKSLMKHALMKCGSRDVSAQLFTALCRALGIPARLVVSLQSVPWQASVGKPKLSGMGGKDKGKGKEEIGDMGENVNVEENGYDAEEVDLPRLSRDVKGKGKATDESFPGDGYRLDGNSSTSMNRQTKEKSRPVITLRKTKRKRQKLGTSLVTQRLVAPDPTRTPPVFWTEVFSRPDARWIPIDPIRCIINRRKLFDPSPVSNQLPTSTKFKQENRMVYVIALEEDSYARDVTPRYAREYGAKVAKVQIGGGGGKRTGNGGKGKQQEWWEEVLKVVTRPYRLHRDDLEDEELASNQLSENMPSTISGFKDHPLYILPRHLHVNEIIHPQISIGSFRGEPVYSRSSLITLKTAENWMRGGRMVKHGEQPMKTVKARVGTIGRMREVNTLKEAGGSESSKLDGETGPMQGLYAQDQTILYKAPPVVDGKVPKNDFGNIDLYVPSMLPEGGVHIPFKGVAKVARKLDFDFAEAVTGFEFKKRRAFPLIEGVVVAAENEAVLLEAYWEAEQDAAEKARAKLHERVIKRWTKLIQGMRIRQRLMDQYRSKEQHEPIDVHMERDKDEQDGEDTGMQAGGFLLGADDVVQAFKLPKYQHAIPTAAPSTPEAPSSSSASIRGSGNDLLNSTFEEGVSLSSVDIHDAADDQNEDMEDVIPPVAQPPQYGAPMSMLQLAEVAARRKGTTVADTTGDDQKILPAHLPDALVITNAKNRSTSSLSIQEKKTRLSKRNSSGKRLRRHAYSSASESEHTPPSKRGRGVAVMSAPTPTRVLRPRTLRSTANVQEGKSIEE